MSESEAGAQRHGLRHVPVFRREGKRLVRRAADRDVGVVVFYGKDDDTTAEGVRIELAEHVLKPFVDAIIARHGAKPGAIA